MRVLIFLFVLFAAAPFASAQGKLKPHIHRIYRFGEIAEALNAIARREVKGKAILVP